MKKQVIILLTLAMSALLSVNASAQYERFSPQYGPWVQNVTETGFTVLFTTAQDCMVAVEVAPDDGSPFEVEPRERYYETVAGRRLCGKRHCITVTGLEPGTTYNYRFIGRVLVDGSNPYGLVYGIENTYNPSAKVTTLASDATECRFSVLNDIHFNQELMKELSEPIDPHNCDFLCLNGDIVSYCNSLDTTLKYTFDPIKKLCSQIPVVYARGNHEGRGMEWHLLPWAFPTNTGEFYYTFRRGPVAFVVLDAGEDKPDSSVEYSGYAQFDQYRAAELEWLKAAVKDPEFASAPIKVCIIHVPAICRKNSWYSQRWINKNFVPVLNDAGIDVMISGHHHSHFVCPAGEFGNDFPIVVNSNDERLDFYGTQSGEFSIECYNAKGKQTHGYKF